MAAVAKTLSDPSLIREKAYINGKWVAARSGETFSVTNPATGEVLGSAPECGVDDLDDAIAAASAAFKRVRVLRRLYDLLVENRADVSRIVTAENGKARADADGEALFAASVFEWFAEEAPRIHGDVAPHASPGCRIQILRQPVGVCGLITPWNFPIAMASRKVAAALAAGCAVVLKSDGVTPFAANALAVLAERAGLPPGVFNVVTALANTPALGLALCRSDSVKKISFTGSTRPGAGGNAPFIVFDDADLETAVAAAVVAKFKVTGQTCVCANRIYVQEGVYERFSARLVEEVKKFRIGNGADTSAGADAVTHGPLTIGVEKTEEHVRDAVAKGATVLLGGRRASALGPKFFELTVLGGVTDDMAVMREETFGPLAALSPFKTEAEVIRRANTSDVGLESYVMTNDLNRQYRVSESLEYGMVAVNTGVISDPASPFGGVKHSGFGREGSKYGLDEYLVLKSIVTGGVHTDYKL
ncbi:hypothetical protein SCUCBS95973_007838 [Sporothrix curviconia]|uniref:Aldehyde dehydrogenase domain-containing protein n=1 Tax=Sporothrix curviconia TaxID=1260050 RepID=A0ABP0CGL9_9PEZI